MILSFIDELIVTNEFNIFIRILLAIILGVAVGLGKELFYRPAGFRVSVIVTISSCLITLVGVYALPEALSAIVGGMIITGGLLTLGIINNNRGDYNGLVSACMVILCTVIGVTAASGLYFAAVVAALLTILAMVILKQVENNMVNRGYVLNIIVDPRRPILKSLLSILESYHLTATSIDSKIVLFERNECVKVRVEFVRGTTRADVERVLTTVKEQINPLSISLRNDTYGVVK